MVIHESFVTRKPLEFTLILLFIVFLLLLPVYFYTKNMRPDREAETALITETFEETIFFFSPDSDLSDSDKKNTFKLRYEGNTVQWEGTMLACDELTGMYRVSVDHTGDAFSDVLFTMFHDCSSIPPGTRITYRTTLIDWKITTFIGKDGEIMSWR